MKQLKLINEIKHFNIITKCYKSRLVRALVIWILRIIFALIIAKTLPKQNSSNISSNQHLDTELIKCKQSKFIFNEYTNDNIKLVVIPGEIKSNICYDNKIFIKQELISKQQKIVNIKIYDQNMNYRIKFPVANNIYDLEINGNGNYIEIDEITDYSYIDINGLNNTIVFDTEKSLFNLDYKGRLNSFNSEDENKKDTTNIYCCWNE